MGSHTLFEGVSPNHSQQCDQEEGSQGQESRELAAGVA